ncbi:MAG: ABC transporter, ATP-binding protein (cluster 13, osmolytes) [uncultured Thermomicrobiales bacterium]|uniref:ABC transporter, ATP-binding protein (Cluster 13, osmolytes) n=1 Tax=uncultured Thermomicrobiales bacterium TaxID=1645740 RepID=A0A6J4V7S3_9BACT|nr:MAG: ABC transporter, ATP-binding protein (cluster 13, osmolytes) [uncultured Thermomicrobiales bacterium]
MTFTVAASQFVVLLGPSGCGKTTLLKLVNRLYEPTSGTIAINGIDTRSLPAPALRRRIGYVIQQTGLFPHMRVGENVAVVPRLVGWDKRRTAARVDELLELVGLPAEEYRRRYPAQLSGGQQQRVGLARALAAEPSTLLMDEPFGALDAITRGRLQDELRHIHGLLGQTVIFVTHDVEEAVRLADRIVVMRDGRIVQDDTPLRILSHPADDFVRDLVGASDVLRRLSLIPVHQAIRSGIPDAADRCPPVTASQNLRTALNLLLDCGAPRLVVVDADARPIGTLDLEAIQQAATVDVASDSPIVPPDIAPTRR